MTSPYSHYGYVVRDEDDSVEYILVARSFEEWWSIADNLITRADMTDEMALEISTKGGAYKGLAKALVESAIQVRQMGKQLMDEIEKSEVRFPS